MASKHSAEVLSSVPECRTAATCRKEKTHVLDKLYSGLSDSALGCEFNVNESTMHKNKESLNRNTQKTRLCTDWLMKMS